jgi:hypothetical protein
MHTVYGIYEPGKKKPVYIGRTVGALSDRLYEHSIKGSGQFMMGDAGIYAYWMNEFRNGAIKLTIRPIATGLTPGNAQNVECALIHYVGPILNLNNKAKMLYGRRVKPIVVTKTNPVGGNPLRKRVLAVKDQVDHKHWLMSLCLIDPMLNECKLWISTASQGIQTGKLKEEHVARLERACETLLNARSTAA